MTLFSTIQLSTSALTAAQLGLSVTSDNIANANTPGYLRQRLIQTPAVPQRYGNLVLGLGVDVEAIVQVTDRYVMERLRSAQSDVARGEQAASAGCWSNSRRWQRRQPLATTSGPIFGACGIF